MCHNNEKWWTIWRWVDLSFQNWHGEFDEFWLEHLKGRILTQTLESLKKCHFNELLLSKVYIVWGKKVQASYLPWHWRVIQNLERNRLVVSKLTWGIWQILTWALESFKNVQFTGLLLSKVYIAWAKKVSRKYLSWHWRAMQNLKKNWLVVWKMTWRIVHFNGLLVTKVYNFELKKYKGVIFKNTEEWWKIWRKTNL